VTQKARNALEMLGTSVSCEIDPWRPDVRCFVYLYPPGVVDESRWVVTLIEVLAATVAVQSSYLEGDGQVRYDIARFNTLEDALGLLRIWRVDDNKLEEGFKLEDRILEESARSDTQDS
jgi:hypothetical protein